jgi:hypothetical protein
VAGQRAGRVQSALAVEREFVKTLGGFVLGLAGAELVTHERIPIPELNFVDVTGVGPGRQAAFFERALDHYFQRALRPTFRLTTPIGDPVAATLTRFGFRPRAAPLVLLLGGTERRGGPATDLTVRAANDSELDELVELWTGAKERPELRAAIDVAWHHPNPGERLTPMVAVRATRIVSAALRYEHDGTAGLFFVSTRPGERGQGAASALVGRAFASGDSSPSIITFLFADSYRLERRLRTLGFEPALSFRVYELPAKAQLAFPAPGPPTPPRWRPPQR